MARSFKRDAINMEGYVGTKCSPRFWADQALGEPFKKSTYYTRKFLSKPGKRARSPFRRVIYRLLSSVPRCSGETTGCFAEDEITKRMGTRRGNFLGRKKSERIFVHSRDNGKFFLRKENSNTSGRKFLRANRERGRRVEFRNDHASTHAFF